MGYARYKSCLPIQLSEIHLAYLDGFYYSHLVKHIIILVYVYDEGNEIVCLALYF